MRFVWMALAIAKPEKLVYFMLNKPKGYVTTVSDPEGRPTVVQILGKSVGRVYPVGRLDYASEGLLLMTNDGALAARMMKAGSHMPKTYLVKVSGKPDEKRIARLRAGIVIELEDGRNVKTSPAKIRLFEDGENPWYEVVLIEGRNRQIRRMFEKVGHLVEKIRRVRMGPLVLDLEPGRFRPLTGKEIELLKKAAERNRVTLAQVRARLRVRPMHHSFLDAKMDRRREEKDNAETQRSQRQRREEKADSSNRLSCARNDNFSPLTGGTARKKAETEIGNMTRTVEELIPDYIRGLPVYVPGRPIEEVERELKIQAVKLASNENPLGPSPLAMEAAKKALAKCAPVSGRRVAFAARDARGADGACGGRDFCGVGVERDY